METENSPPVEPEESAPAARQPPKKPGPESKVTAELVKRVSERVARGIPIRVALSGEQVSWTAYKKHLQRHPELKAIQKGAKIQFLDKAFDMILSRPGPMLRWLLERRHPELFAKPREEAAIQTTDSDPQIQTQTQYQTIAGVPQEALEEARRNAQKIH